MNKPRVMVSAIVPVYNTEAYLEGCVRSLLMQSFSNIELILVDDGSTDKSGAICDTLAKEDERITVIHCKNSGVGAARNRGIEKAVGDFLFFCDSDDAYRLDFVEKALYSIYSNNSQLAIAAVNVCKGGVVYGVSDYIPSNINRLTVFAVAEYMLKCGVGCYWWGNIAKLYITDIIKRNSLSFIEGVSVTEDYTFNIDYLKCIDNVSIIHEGLYDFRSDSEGSLSKQAGDSLKRWELFKRLYKLESAFYDQVGLYNANKALIDSKIVSYGVQSLFQIMSDNAIRGLGGKRAAFTRIARDESLQSAYYSRSQLPKRSARIAGLMANDRIASAVMYVKFIMAARRLKNI